MFIPSAKKNHFTLLFYFSFSLIFFLKFKFYFYAWVLLWSNFSPTFQLPPGPFPHPLPVMPVHEYRATLYNMNNLPEAHPWGQLTLSWLDWSFAGLMWVTTDFENSCLKWWLYYENFILKKEKSKWVTVGI